MIEECRGASGNVCREYDNKFIHETASIRVLFDIHHVRIDFPDASVGLCTQVISEMADERL